jgi:regulatory protein
LNRARDNKPKSPGAASPYQRGLGLLARREHSARELKLKLEQREIDAGEAAAVVRRLAEQGAQSDLRFGESLARTRAGQGYGPQRVRAELRSHGLDETAIAAAIDSLDADWTANARAALRRRHAASGPADAAERARRARFLLRRGFDPATVRAITRADVDVADDAFG